MDVDPVVLRTADLAVAAVLVIGGGVAGRWSRAAGGLLLATAATWLLAEQWGVALFWHRALLVHLVLAYPRLRPPNRAAGGVVALAYVACVVFPASLLDDRVSIVFGIVLAVAAWWSSRAPGVRTRHQRRRVLTAGVSLGAVMVAIGTIGWAADDLMGDWALLAYEAAVVALSIIVVTGLRPPSLDRMARLVIELGATPADGLRDAIARATRDHEVEVGFWDQRAQSFLSHEGVAVDAGLDADRTSIVVEDEAGPFCMVVLDAVLAGDAKVRASVEAAGRVVAVNARRTAAVAERVRELVSSRRRLLEAADDERAVLEAELRAGVLNKIADLAAAVKLVGDQAPSSHVDRAVEHLEGTSVDLVDAAAGLRPRDLDDGLEEALARLARTSSLPVHLRGEAGPLPPGVELTVWYLCGEALTNSVKHSGATGVEVCLVRTEDRLRVVVSDDGVGGAEVHETGGLAGLRDRVTSYAGHMDVIAGPTGTTLTAEFPIEVPTGADAPHSTRTHSRANWKSGNGKLGSASQPRSLN